MLPRNIIAGWMIPEMNCAPKLALYSSSFLLRNRCSTSCCWPNTFTSACPVNASSICALRVPVCRHWATKRFFDRLVTKRMMNSDVGIVMAATVASRGEMTNIIVRTPISDSTDVSSWLSVCCRLCEMLSMSLVTRLSRSPRGCESM